MSAYLTRTGRLPRTVFDLIAARQLGQVATTAIVTRIVSGVRGGAARHGAYLQIQGRGRPARVWMGISPNDRHVIRLALRAIVVASLRRQGVGVVG